MSWFWDNVNLKKEDRQGMIIFILLIACLLGLKCYLVIFFEPISYLDREEILANIEFGTIVQEDEEIKKSESLPKRQKAENIIRKTKTKVENQPVIRSKERELFSFDPNFISEDSLHLLGINRYAAQNIMKYRAKGGRFNKPEDLKKIYGLDSSQYTKLLPYIRFSIPPKSDKADRPKAKYKARKLAKLIHGSIDVNKADTASFKKLRGIGTVYANRIVKFRNSLGGFYSIDQINQVWGISDSLYLAKKPYLTIETGEVRKKNINKMDLDHLVKHPYINYRKARIITKFRKMHGDFQSMKDFEKVHGISDEFLDTLIQYFDVR